MEADVGTAWKVGPEGEHFPVDLGRFQFSGNGEAESQGQKYKP
jgi:hypothetical protein